MPTAVYGGDRLTAGKQRHRGREVLEAIWRAVLLSFRFLAALWDIGLRAGFGFFDGSATRNQFPCPHGHLATVEQTRLAAMPHRSCVSSPCEAFLYEVGRKHVATLMRRTGVEALYRKPDTSKRHLEHQVYPYLPVKLHTLLDLRGSIPTFIARGGNEQWAERTRIFAARALRTLEKGALSRPRAEIADKSFEPISRISDPQQHKPVLRA